MLNYSILIFLFVSLTRAFFIPKIEFGLLSQSYGTPVHQLGLSIDEDGRVGFLPNVRYPLEVIFEEDGRISIPGLDNTYLVIGANKILEAREVLSGAVPVFNVTDDDHLIYNGTTVFSAMQMGLPNEYHFFIYDPLRVSEKPVYNTTLRLLWNIEKVNRYKSTAFRSGFHAASVPTDSSTEPEYNSTIRISNDTFIADSNFSANVTALGNETFFNITVSATISAQASSGFKIMTTAFVSLAIAGVAALITGGFIL